MIIKILLLLIVFFITPFNVSASIYYVSSSGLDTNNGSQSSPWKTIQKAANTAVAGDVVNVSSGTYEEVVTEGSSGNSGNLIRYLAHGEALIRSFNLNGNYIELNGFTVTPTGTCKVNWNGAVQSSGSNNVIVNNTVKDSIITGLKLMPTANSNTVSGNTIIRTNVNGLAINGTNHTIENNDISDIRNIVNGCNWWNDTNAISFFGSGSVYRKNHIHNMIWENQSGTPHVDAFQTHSANSIPASNTIIEQNRIFLGNDATGKIEGAVTDLQGFHGFMIAGSNNIVIRNNIIESRHGLNIGGGGGVSNLKIYHNIWRGDINSTTAWPTGTNISGVNGYEIFNNIFIDFKYSHITVKNGSSGGSTNKNMFWNSDGTTPGFEGYIVQPQDKRGVNPNFVSNFTDYHLQVNSPAIDAGTNVAVTNDYAGTSRPQGTGYDIGVYEYTGTPGPSATPTTQTTPTWTPTPTPTPTPIPGDIDRNEVVEINDYNILLSNFGKTGENLADIDNNGKVDIYDYNLIIKNFGMSQ